MTFFVPGVWPSGYLDAQRVDRGAGREEQRPEIAAAEGEVRGHLRRANDPEPGAVGCEDPGAARPRAKDPALDVHLHTVGDTVRLAGGRVGEATAAHEVAAGV